MARRGAVRHTTAILAPRAAPAGAQVAGGFLVCCPALAGFFLAGF
jgi:hypothetical protein